MPGTLNEKLIALRKFFGLSEALELPTALATMREAVRVAPEGDLITQVDALLAATRMEPLRAGRRLV